MTRNRRRTLRPVFERLDDRCLLSVSGYSPAQVKTAYGLNAISFTTTTGQKVAGDGTGTTIAIVVAYHDPNLASDLSVFDATFGLATPSLTQVNLGSASNTDDGWAGEETLDVEWAHAIAPGAKIVVVEARSDSTTDLLAAVGAARNVPGVVAVSMSWGGSEMANEAAYDSYFTTPAGHTGITFIAASGDTGTSGGAEWPAVSSKVLAVGGTSLVINSASGYGGESSWSGGGAGTSRYIAEPTYQLSLQSSGRRTEPDVAFLADPNTGVAVYTTNPSNGQGGWEVVGGTSVGTPAWAGIIAIIDEGLNLSGKGSLDGATQTLPELYALSTSDFHTVANATVTNFRSGTVISTVGLGTPIGQNLISDLVPLITSIGTTTTTTTTGTGTTTTGTGTTVTTTANLVSEVKGLYQAILGRVADTSGLTNAVNYLASGGSITQFASDLFHSAEYDTKLVVNDYQTDLGRSPTSSEVDAAVAALQAGVTESQLSATLLKSTEFLFDHSADADFVRAAYQATLGRAASTTEVSTVVSVINAGTSRNTIIDSLLSSVEAARQTIQTLYQTFLGRSPDVTGSNAALVSLQNGTLSPIDLATLLVTSPESVANMIASGD